MANSTQEDYNEMNLSDLIPFVFSGLLSLSGLLIQSFIVAVNVIDWLKGRSITGADQIITSIGVLRIVLHTAFLVLLFFDLETIPEIVSSLAVFTVRNSNIAHIWLSTLLSIFFYANISTSHNVFFLRLKAIISRRVVCLIIGSVMLSIVYSSLYYFALSTNFVTNSTQDCSIYYRQEQIMLYVDISWTIFPLLIFGIASLLLIILLGFHMSRMNIGGNVTSSTDTYHRIMTFTIVSFLSCAFYITVSLLGNYIRLMDIFWLFVIMNIFPVLHSVLLIYVTTKLRNQFFRIVHCWFNRNAPGPRSRESMEVTSM